MGINFQRILIVSFFNFLIKKLFNQCDFFVKYDKIVDHSILYECTHCLTLFNSKFVIIRDIIKCPCCNNSNLEEHNSPAT